MTAKKDVSIIFFFLKKNVLFGERYLSTFYYLIAASSGSVENESTEVKKLQRQAIFDLTAKKKGKSPLNVNRSNLYF